MPIEVEIDTERRVVIATARGTMTRDDMFGYQRDVWSRPEVAGFDEVIDVSGVSHFDSPSTDQVRQMTQLAESMESSPSKLAIVAPNDFAFGLARMYQAMRTSSPNNQKDVGVFRTLEAAWMFLERAAS